MLRTKNENISDNNVIWKNNFRSRLYLSRFKIRTWFAGDSKRKYDIVERAWKYSEFSQDMFCISDDRHCLNSSVTYSTTMSISDETQPNGNISVPSKFTPFVFWAQREDRILLKVGLKNLKVVFERLLFFFTLPTTLKSFQDKQVSVSGNSVFLKATAEGQNGEQNYDLQLDLFSDINSTVSLTVNSFENEIETTQCAIQNWRHAERENYIDFAIFKEEAQWWPKLLCTNHQNPPWLKVGLVNFSNL